MQSPDIFGNVPSQPGSFWWKPNEEFDGYWLFKQFEEALKLKLKFYLDVGIYALLERDPRWSDGSQSYYIHNLVSETKTYGVGARIIFCEKAAIENGKKTMRLDCQASNPKLNSYYVNLG